MIFYEDLNSDLSFGHAGIIDDEARGATNQREGRRIQDTAGFSGVVVQISTYEKANGTRHHRRCLLDFPDFIMHFCFAFVCGRIPSSFKHLYWEGVR